MSRMIIAVDPHKASVTIEVVDQHGMLAATGRLPTARGGYRALMRYVKQWLQRLWAVEGAGGTGRPLVLRLVRDGERVLDVPAKLAARVRVSDTGQGRKTDATDAHSIAAVRSTPAEGAQGRAADRGAPLWVAADGPARHRPCGRRPAAGRRRHDHPVPVQGALRVLERNGTAPLDASSGGADPSPAWLRVITDLNPMTYAVDAAQNLALGAAVGTGALLAVGISLLPAATGAASAAMGIRRP
jgi:hypothetical protein